ncbi:MAG: radical SAM protein [Bacteroidota bacterium]
MALFIKNRKIYTEGVSLAAASHCNLHCADCCAVSPYASARFPSLSQVQMDLSILGEVLHARELRLLGGEPLLNPEIGELARLGKESGIADLVTIFTNGRLLHKMDQLTWQNLDQLMVSVYPEAPLSDSLLSEVADLAAKYNVQLRILRRHRFHTRVVNTPHPLDLTTRLIYRTCRPAHYDHCHRLHEGRLYQCYIPLALPDYLRRIGHEGYAPEQDGLALYGQSDLFSAVKDHILSPEPLQACQYCLATLGKRRPHRQLTAEELRDPAGTEISRRTHLSPTRTALHLAGHIVHLAADRLRGGVS